MNNFLFKIYVRACRLDSCRGSQDPGREHECGRPLGLKFNPDTGELYVADAYHGLRVVSPDDDKVSRPVAPQWWQGRAFSFANGVEVDPDTGAVYFTETSTRLQRREFLTIVISGDTTGRLLRYDPKSGDGEVEVLADGLAFPNGLAMSRDGTHLLLAETTTGRILRYWLRPVAKALAIEEVARLPWFPDNIRMSPRGGFWVGSTPGGASSPSGASPTRGSGGWCCRCRRAMSSAPRGCSAGSGGR